MTCPARLNPVDVLTTEGPLDTEAMSRKLKCTISGARRKLTELVTAGLIANRKVTTKRNRNGVWVWFVVGDARIDAVADDLRRTRTSTFNRPYRESVGGVDE